MNKNESPGHGDKRALHFSKTLWLALSFVILAWAFFYFTLGHYSESDKIAYERLVSGENEEAILTEPQVSKQRRTGLQKNIFFNDNHQRLEFKMKSANSELALEKVGRHIEVVEHLQDVVCWLQESVYFVLPDGRQAHPQKDGRFLIKGELPDNPASWISEKNPGIVKEQMVLMLTAENATYHYKGGAFVAKNVKVLRYINQNRSLEEMTSDSRVITDGVASKVEFSLAGNGMDFTADNFKAKFSMKSGVR